MRKLIFIIAFVLSSLCATATNDGYPMSGQDFYICDLNNSRANESDDHWKVSSTIVRCFDENNIGEDAWMMTADGSTQLKVTLDYEGADSRYTISGQNVQFYFYEGNDIFHDDNKELIVDTNLYIGNYSSEFSDNQASVTITSPSKYPLSSGSYYSYYVVIKVKFKNGGTASVAKNIGVCRPGVLILHGLNDSSSTFQTMKSFLVESGGWFNSSILTKDYSATNTSSFYANTHQNQVVKIGLYELSNNMLSNGIASTKYDMIGHSMGGILERLYIQEIDNEHTYKLITLNTPHFGAPLGNVAPALFYCLDHLPPNIISIFANKFFNPTGGREAVSDLAIGSNAIANLNSNNYRLRDIPVFAVGSYLNADISPSDNQYIEPGMMTEESTFLLAHVFYNEVPRNRYNYLFSDDTWGDGVVSITSQEGGLSPRYYSMFNGPFSGAFHCNSPKWFTTLDEIRLLLLSEPDSNIFSMTGFGAMPQQSIRNISSRSSSDYITSFSEPKQESYIKLSAHYDADDNSICHTSIESSTDMTTTMVFSFLSHDKMISSYDENDASFNLHESCDSITLYAIGRTNYNALLVDSITINRTDNSGIQETAWDMSNSKEKIIVNNNRLMVMGATNNYSIEIYNLMGTKVATYIKNDIGIYDISSLNDGIYIAKLTCQNKFHSFKFSK